MTLQERNESPDLLLKVPPEPVATERRLSIPTRIRSVTPSSMSDICESVLSVPFFVASSAAVRRRRQSVRSFNNENVLQTPSKLIDPIESRVISLKHKGCLDASLVNQVKTRADFLPNTAASHSGAIQSPLSSTWRADVSKIFDHMQTLKSPSYRETVCPPLSDELPCDLFERLYGMGGADGHDCSSHRPLSSRRMNSSPKGSQRPRSSVTSVHSAHKTKK